MQVKAVEFKFFFFGGRGKQGGRFFFKGNLSAGKVFSKQLWTFTSSVAVLGVITVIQPTMLSYPPSPGGCFGVRDAERLGIGP